MQVSIDKLTAALSEVIQKCRALSSYDESKVAELLLALRKAKPLLDAPVPIPGELSPLLADLVRADFEAMERAIDFTIAYHSLHTRNLLVTRAAALEEEVKRLRAGLYFQKAA